MKKKILLLLGATAVLISLSLPTVYAQGSIQSNTAESTAAVNPRESIPQILDRLLKEGKITQVEKESALKFFNEGEKGFSKLPKAIKDELEKQRAKHHNPFAGLNDDQKKKVKASLENGRNKAVNELIKKGVITSDQAKNLLSDKKVRIDKGAFTKEQIDSIKEAFRNAKKEALDNLVKDQVITKEQADQFGAKKFFAKTKPE